MTLFEGNNILSIIEMITTALKQHKINTNVTYRLKHPISILDKMITKNVDLHEIKDLIAFRLIVQKLKDCYMQRQICLPGYDRFLCRFGGERIVINSSFH